jgi:hypothetical protein
LHFPKKQSWFYRFCCTHCVCTAVLLAIFMFIGQRAEATLLNRIVLTVGESFYSANEAYALLAIRKSLDAKEEKIQTDFLRNENFPFLSRDLQASATSSAGEEARLLLFMVLSYQESLKLKIFQPDEKSKVLTRTNIFRERDAISKKFVPQEFQPSVVALLGNQEILNGLLEIVLRSQAFQAARGNFAKNPSLLSQPWLWNRILKKAE